MKKLLALFCCIFPSIGFAFEFNDAALQACVNALAEKNNWQRAEQVVSIKCHNKGIKSIAGIEQFQNLQVLSLHKNKIASVELHGFPHLHTLNIARNPFPELTLETLPALKVVYAFDGKMKAIRLNALPKLEQIKINQNQLEHFSYQALPKLKKITVFDNQLEHFDIYNLPGLTYMDCRQNPMPDPLYEEMDALTHITFLHDGNADDW